MSQTDWIITIVTGILSYCSGWYFGGKLRNWMEDKKSNERRLDRRGVSNELPDYTLYKMVEELKDGVYVQFVGVRALEWQSQWGRPKYGFIEYDPPNGS